MNDIVWLSKKIKLSKLKDFHKNPRQISKSDFERLVRDIKQDGYHSRVKVDTNDVIIGGHQRKKALLQAGYKENDEIEVLYPNRPLTEEEFERLNIRDNLSFGEFDFDILANEFDQEQLIEWGMPEEWFPEVTHVEGLTDEDDCPSLSEHAVTEPGDIWLLGNHRLMCGDSTNPQHVEKLVQEHSPNLMVTDPPYGVNYDPSWREGADLGVGKRSKGKVQNDDKADWTETYSLFTGNVAYIWHAGKYTHIVAKNLEDCGFEIISQIIWGKQHFVLSRGDYHWQHEPCWYAVRKGQTHNWQGARDQATLWDIKNNNSFGNSEKEQTWGHGTQKPVECMRRPVINNTKPKEYVYDPFGGSGTTLIACEKENRLCLMMELDPKYCDVIVKRWQDFTGKKAILESDGSTFDDLATKRKLP